MGRWEPDARGRLERAALELFVERGFEQATVTDIARRAGLAQRTFFRHFADKREVLFSGASTQQEYLVSAVAQSPGRGDADRRGRRGPRGRGRRTPGARRVRPAAPDRHRGEPGTAGARADQARLARGGDRRRAARARGRRTGREPGRRGGDRRLQDLVRALGQRAGTAGPAGAHPGVVRRAQGGDRRHCITRRRRGYRRDSSFAGTAGCRRTVASPGRRYRSDMLCRAAVA